MAEIIRFDNLKHELLRPYASLTEATLRRGDNTTPPLFIAESPKVILRALDAGYEPVSLLCEQKHIDGDAAEVISRLPAGVPVLTADRNLLSRLTGYTLTRGVLAAFLRRPLPDVKHVLANSSRIAVLAGVCDATNVGAIFRSAAALGIDAILLSEDACDPLCRRAVRVSMGNVFSMPWTRVADIMSTSRDFAFRTLAMALRADALPINKVMFDENSKLALIFGTEGDGLPDNIVSSADTRVIIPMSNDVDSLNVATSAAIAFWHFRH